MPKMTIPADVWQRAQDAAELCAHDDGSLNVGAAVNVVVEWLDETFRLSDPRHLVKVDPDGWTVQHPQTCRPNLFTCPWSNQDKMRDARENDSWEPEPVNPGYVYVGGEIPDPFSPDGTRLILGDRVEES